MKKRFILLTVFTYTACAFAQQKTKWYEPTFIEGVCRTDTTNIYHRLPVEMKKLVREAVWDLSENTAGEFIHFRTSARNIKVKYTLTSKNFSMPHMPSTGMSGLDLFALDKHGKWNWAPGRYSFGDTCTYTFNHLFIDDNAGGITDFFLYLPLYNAVKWLSIGVDETTDFSFAEKQKEKPVVAYGTSILQGGVASRPGLAWTNILARNIKTTVINLGFSGNGRFEEPLFDLMATVDARLYILDCMPNLAGNVTPAEILRRVEYGVNKLRQRNREVPLLLVEHAAGYAPYYMDTARLNQFSKSSDVIAGIYQKLKSDGVSNIYLLTQKEIGFDINSTTDGVHPNDIGMMKYAEAFEKKIREILPMK